MKRMPKGLIRFAVSAVIVLAILIGVGAFGYFASAGPTERKAGPGSEPLRVNTHTVQWEAGYTVERSFVGRVEARRSSDLGFEIGGMVLEVLVEEGQPVAVGDPIARIDTQRLRARRAELYAARDRAMADYELAETTRRRIRGNADRGAATQQEIDDVEQAYDAASAVLEQAKAAVASNEVEIDKASIISPFDAVVAERYVDEGQVIAAGSPVARLLELARPQVRVGIAGDLIDKVQVGQDIAISIRERPITGQVEAILPTREARARVVDVLIRLDIELDGIRQGDLARVAVPRDVEQRGFWVPTQALTEGVRGLWSVYLIEQESEGRGDAEAGAGQALKRVDIELLHIQGDEVYVRGALESGDLLVADGLQRVAPGMSVRIASSDTQTGELR